LPRGATGTGRWNSFRVGVSVVDLFVRRLYGQRLSDEPTFYKAFPTSLLRTMDLRRERCELCAVVTAKACRLGLTILEVPIRYDPRTAHQGKKTRWRDGLEALATP
jgi:hypothetical protein